MHYSSALRFWKTKTTIINPNDFQCTPLSKEALLSVHFNFIELIEEFPTTWSTCSKRLFDEEGATLSILLIPTKHFFSFYKICLPRFSVSLLICTLLSRSLTRSPAAYRSINYLHFCCAPIYRLISHRLHRSCIRKSITKLWDLNRAVAWHHGSSAQFRYDSSKRVNYRCKAVGVIWGIYFDSSMKMDSRKEPFNSTHVHWGKCEPFWASLNLSHLMTWNGP